MSVEQQIAGKHPDAPSVFLSYVRDDEAKAQSLLKALESNGFSVWWDGLIGGGRDFADRIEQALSDADVVVVLWSQQSLHSHWVRDEASFGRDHGCMVPVTLDGCLPPLGFRQLQSVNLQHWYGDTDSPEFEELCRSIRAVAGEPEESHRSASPRPLLSRRAVMTGAGAVAIAAAGGAAFWLFDGKPAELTSIAVLPFKDLGGSDSYFSDGLAEELRATLSRVDQLAVAAQTSSDSFKDGKTDARSMAKALGVAFLLEGSVRRSADLIRVSTRIVNGKTGLEKWAQNFDRSAADSLSIQTAIAAFVADALLAGLAKEQRPSDRIGGTRNNKAFDAYLRGNALYREASGKEGDLGALAAFEQAISLDPSYAAAHAARSRVLTVIANNYATDREIPVYYQRSIEAAREAIRLAPDMAEGHSALGFVLFNGQLDARAAEAPYQRSFELGYGNAEILSAYANFAARTGRFDEGREAIVRAQRLDPLNPTVFRNAGLLEYSARDYDSAVTSLRTALSLNPKASNVHAALGDIALMRGDLDAASGHFAEEGDRASRFRGLAIVKMRQGNASAAAADYARLIKEGGGTVHYQQAQILAQWGRKDEALSQLEQALAQRDAGLVRLRNDPLLDPVRGDARFAKIKQRIGFA